MIIILFLFQKKNAIKIPISFIIILRLIVFFFSYCFFFDLAQIHSHCVRGCVGGWVGLGLGWVVLSVREIVIE